MILKKKLTPGVALTRPWGYIHVHITILVKQVYWYISQVSGERLQDHWSSGCLSYQLKTDGGKCSDKLSCFIAFTSTRSK